MNLKSSDQWISNEKAGKYEIEFHAIARIYQLLGFPMEPHIDWTKYRFMGEIMVYLGFTVHANHIIAKEEMIIAIHDLTTPRYIHEEGSYQGLAWFYVLDCTGKIKTKWTGKLRISFPKIANILCTTLTLLQNFIMHFNVRSDVYTIGGSSLPIPSMDA